MKCWVCSRQARGFAHGDGRYAIADPRRYPLDWVFCSQRCQNAFHTLYGNWREAKRFGSEEIEMIDASELEKAAMRDCLKAFGSVAGSIGFEKPLGDYSEAEALLVIDAIVTCYTDTMIEQHEETRFPPIKGLTDTVNNPFADLEDPSIWNTPTPTPTGKTGRRP
jgi:hypothetical protein